MSALSLLYLYLYNIIDPTCTVVQYTYKSFHVATYRAEEFYNHFSDSFLFLFFFSVVPAESPLPCCGNNTEKAELTVIGIKCVFQMSIHSVLPRKKGEEGLFYSMYS